LELAQRMVQLGEVECGEIGEIAQDFGRQLLAREGWQDSGSTTPNHSQDSPQPIATEALNREADAYFDQANQQYMEGNFLGAIACYDQVLHIKPDYHEAWFNRGVALAELGQFEEGIASYDQALHFKPDYQGSLVQPGRCAV
jgi:tetratricopeptide (TPR) repeat protein